MLIEPVKFQDLRPDWIDITVTASIPTTATALQLRFLESEKVFNRKFPEKNGYTPEKMGWEILHLLIGST